MSSRQKAFDCSEILFFWFRSILKVGYARIDQEKNLQNVECTSIYSLTVGTLQIDINSLTAIYTTLVCLQLNLRMRLRPGFHALKSKEFDSQLSHLSSFSAGHCCLVDPARRNRSRRQASCSAETDTGYNHRMADGASVSPSVSRRLASQKLSVLLPIVVALLLVIHEFVWVTCFRRMSTYFA